MTREGRTRLELNEDERLQCGKCLRLVEGCECPLTNENAVYISTDGVESQDFVILCESCLDELAGPEFEEAQT